MCASKNYSHKLYKVNLNVQYIMMTIHLFSRTLSLGTHFQKLPQKKASTINLKKYQKFNRIDARK